MLNCRNIAISSIVCVVALLSLAASASAAIFAASPGSLGLIPETTANGCNAYGENRDVTFNVSGVSEPITNVAVSMTLNHGAVGDLSVVLFSPDGVGNTTLFERTGSTAPNYFGSQSAAIGAYTFSDAAPASPSWWGAAAATPAGEVIPSGSYRISIPGEQPSPPAGNSLLLTPIWASYFAGTPSPNGTWTLRFRDKCQIYIGSVSAATLALNEPLTTPGPGPGTPPSKKKCKKRKKHRAAQVAKKKKCKHKRRK